ncbi:MAG: AMP-binding protein [Paracoccaceae bacterium]
MTTLPGLDAAGHWVLPQDLNMARQCLSQDEGNIAIRDLTGGTLRDITYRMLGDRVDSIAAALLCQIRPGARIGVLLGQSVGCLAAHLAIWKIGAISVPLFKLFQHDALQSRIADSGCEIVLTDPEGAVLLGDLAQAWMVDEIEPSGPVPFADTTPETPAILIYTSGTTGKPKGALHGHRVLTGHLPGVALSHNHLGQAGDVLWTPADWAWIGGLFDVALAGLALGVPVVAARMSKFDPKACAQICAQAHIRNVFFPPTALRMLKAADQNISGLRSVASGGEPLGHEMRTWGRRAFELEINEFYGQTECNMVVSSCAAEFPAHPGSIGKPVPGFTLAVLDAQGQPTTEIGQIAVGKDPASMMLGYWNAPEATREKFSGDWLLTGDTGCWEGDYIRFVGRADDVITSAGYRIGPSEIEDCLLTHPCVATVGVVGKPDPLRTEIVKAYVVANPDHPCSIAELQAWVKARLASYSYPREIEFIDALPMTVTGKVIRKALKARAVAEGQGRGGTQTQRTTG